MRHLSFAESDTEKVKVPIKVKHILWVIIQAIFKDRNMFCFFKHSQVNLDSIFV